MLTKLQGYNFLKSITYKKKRYYFSKKVVPLSLKPRLRVKPRFFTYFQAPHCSLSSER